MKPETIDWRALERLRAGFLTSQGGGGDYWQSETDLASYDLTFAQRIGWKWDYALQELQRRDWTPPPGDILDWGCGSGIASRAFLDVFGFARNTKLFLRDRSQLACRYAARRAAAKYPGLGVEILPAPEPAPPVGTLLLSHVITELDDAQRLEARRAATQAAAVLWIEPGTHAASHALIAQRELLRPFFTLVAPCVHGAACGLLRPENQGHWCHHFAPPPAGIFADSDWVRFARIAGVDLRSLPLSYLVLDKRPQPAWPTGAVRVLGRPRLYKGYALVLGCAAEGIADRRLTRRALPEHYRLVKKGELDSLLAWRCEQEEILEIKTLFAASES